MKSTQIQIDNRSQSVTIVDNRVTEAVAPSGGIRACACTWWAFAHDRVRCASARLVIVELARRTRAKGERRLRGGEKGAAAGS